MRSKSADVGTSGKTFTTTIVRNGSMCFIPLTFDPKPVFGRIRAPVKVTLNGYTYRSTIAVTCFLAKPRGTGPIRPSCLATAIFEKGDPASNRVGIDAAGARGCNCGRVTSRK